MSCAASQKLRIISTALLLLTTAAAGAETPPDAHDHMDHASMGHGSGGMAMTFDAEGMVMHSNETILPQDCKSISKDHEFTVYAGTSYAESFPGNIFGFSQHEFKVEPCSRIRITLINEDTIRHQFMVHGLPRYIYPQGMFHIEAVGGATKSGTFIVPSDDKTYLAHCDIAQHTEKGMKAQIKAGRGSGDLTSIPGVSAPFRPNNYLGTGYQLLAMGFGFILAIFGAAFWWRRD